MDGSFWGKDVEGVQVVPENVSLFGFLFVGQCGVHVLQDQNMISMFPRSLARVFKVTMPLPRQEGNGATMATTLDLGPWVVQPRLSCSPMFHYPHPHPTKEPGMSLAGGSFMFCQELLGRAPGWSFDAQLRPSPVPDQRRGATGHHSLISGGRSRPCIGRDLGRAAGTSAARSKDGVFFSLLLVL